ncbi:MAG: dTDP-4-dehydrorhamnose 3,5-epimerase [Vicinamibacterales bacterium]|nr:dTDP-4-dehydrorhamnose 3,5-epimerase [Vicinamibacterales bacterium]
MKFHELPLSGAWLIELDKHGDDRGFFARAFCADEFAQHGLENNFVQANDSLSATAGTLRGLHYQNDPYSEAKLVRCIRGRLYDVLVDLRPDSATFTRWHGVELSADNRRSLYVPPRFAHGFITLESDTETLYLTSARYAPEHERAVRWDDPCFNIEWPIAPAVMSDRDQSHRDFDRDRYLALARA